jgi:hypothetical protein
VRAPPASGLRGYYTGRQGAEEAARLFAPAETILGGVLQSFEDDVCLYMVLSRAKSMATEARMRSKAYAEASSAAVSRRYLLMVKGRSYYGSRLLIERRSSWRDNFGASRLRKADGSGVARPGRGQTSEPNPSLRLRRRRGSLPAHSSLTSRKCRQTCFLVLEESRSGRSRRRPMSA